MQLQYEYGLTRSPANLIFGPGQRKAVGRVAASLGTRVLVCTDKRLAESPLIAEMTDALASQGVSARVFDGTEAELPLEGILDCVGQYRDFDPEVFVGFGGGSCMDLAKVVSLLMTHSGPVSDYYGEFKVTGPIRPVIAIPTTAGTGSEVTPVAVIADPQRDMKVGISSPELIPHTAICDPELTLSCPRMLTALSGADAMGHAVEAFSAIWRSPDPEMALERVFVGKNVLSDQYALTAIGLLHTHLEEAVVNGDNLEARSAVMLGSTYAGLAFSTAGTSAAHAIQYPVGAKTHTAHGLGIGTLLPYAMEFNLDAAQAAYAAIGRAIGVASANDDERAQAVSAIVAVRTLFQRIGIPATLRELGVAPEDLDAMAQAAVGARRLVDNNPERLDVPAIRTILDRAFQGIHTC